MAVSTDESVVTATAGSGGRSSSKRLTNSAARCWASAADPPLPQKKSLPPRARPTAMVRAVRSTRAQLSAKNRDRTAAPSSAYSRMMRSALSDISVHSSASDAADGMAAP